MSLKEDAINHMQTAEYVLGMTYNLSDDPKILKTVLFNIYKSLKCTMAYACGEDNDYDRLIRKTRTVLLKNNLSLDYMKYLKEIGEVMKKQKECEVEFSRRNKYVFASLDYKLHELKKKDVEEYLLTGKLFMNQTLDVIK
ncbi:MAG: hypothetical protein NDI94_02250 [Candidatus Woesearchaeota archaeon]|nr:hypothetical protein [Candidatus Woesearchaeota archaeon]